MFGSKKYVEKVTYDGDMSVIRADIRFLRDTIHRLIDGIDRSSTRTNRLAKALGYEIVDEPEQIVARKIKKA